MSLDNQIRKRLIIEPPTYERDDSLLIRSHQSYDPQVAGVCHHSGRYLQGDEINPTPFLERLLLEQHDFPGLRRLDEAFASAFHAEQHQHVEYSKPVIQGLALIVSSLVIAGAILGLFLQLDYVSRPFWYVIIGVLIVAAVIAVGLFSWGFLFSVRKNHIFHQQAAGKPPKIQDFPILGTYFITAQEDIHVSLDNLTHKPPEQFDSQASISVRVEPKQANWESFSQYREQYVDYPDVGRFVHAGVIALSNLDHTQFKHNSLEFDHRFVLRAPSNRLRKEGEAQHFLPFTMKKNYSIKKSALLPQFKGMEHFPLECDPKLARLNSRTLELHFRWRGPHANAKCRLDECILDIPHELSKVTRVRFGRFDQERNQVIWRNRNFNQQSLALEITFENPILECTTELRGAFTFSVEDLLSGLTIEKAHVWTALGKRAAEQDITIEKKTVIEGDLKINLQRLSQEHEYVKSAETIERRQPPSDKLIDIVLAVLLEEGFDIQQITQATPRLDTSGRLDKLLHYWDIVGRRYDSELLDALDIHVVVSGTSATNRANDNTLSTTIDLRIRCLHDPRNKSTPLAVDTLVGTPEKGLAAHIRQQLDKQLPEDPAELDPGSMDS